MMPADFNRAVQADFGLLLSQEQTQALCRYVVLLKEWSARVRLISKGDRNHIWDRHIVDCLSVVPSLPPTGAVLDFGSGAGLPGIPVAIALPNLKVHLLEPARMKALFLNRVVQDLGLGNVTVLRVRSEELIQEKEYTRRYDYVTARAVAALPILWQMVLPLLSPSGRLVALKGPNVATEMEGFSLENLTSDIQSFTLPMSHRERTLVTLKNVSRETSKEQ